MSILLEKYKVEITGNTKRLPYCTTIFNNIDELLDFIKKTKESFLGNNFMITITEINEYKKNKLMKNR